jgi:hypothetical protein
MSESEVQRLALAPYESALRLPTGIRSTARP